MSVYGMKYLLAYDFDEEALFLFLYFTQLGASLHMECWW